MFTGLHGFWYRDIKDSKEEETERKTVSYIQYVQVSVHVSGHEINWTHIDHLTALYRSLLYYLWGRLDILGM